MFSTPRNLRRKVWLRHLPWETRIYSVPMSSTHSGSRRIESPLQRATRIMTVPALVWPIAAVQFNGITHDKLSAAQTLQANSLANTLDRYNNNLLCLPKQA